MSTRMREIEINIDEARERMMKGLDVYCQDSSGMWYDVDMITKGGEVASASAGGDLFMPVTFFKSEVL